MKKLSDRRKISKVIIPTVYAEGLSYYEQLIRLINAVNDLIDYNNGVIGDSIIQSFNEWLSAQYVGMSYDESTKSIIFKTETED